MARPISIKMDFDAGDVEENIRRFPEKVDRAVALSVDYNAPYASAWMKTHAPWHDDTGAARAGLVAIPHHFGKTHELTLAHSVHYGIWLEVAHNRRYQILSSAMRHIGPKVIADARRILAATV